jgi:5'-3' exoribonuclease 1
MGHRVLEYYHHGVKSWNWFYSDLYAPLASDMTNMSSMRSSFEYGRPVTPLMQLLSVLPAESGRLLPAVYRELMTDRLSPLAEFYPREFEVDINGKRQAWEAVVKIPFIDEGIMDHTVSYIDHETSLNSDEKERNQHGKEHHFKPKTTAAKSKLRKTKPDQIKTRAAADIYKNA